MVNFYTIFPRAENVHLIKDVGMIPYYLHKNYSYNSTLVTYKIDNYPYSESIVKGLKIEYLKKISGIPTIDVLIFLLINSRKIDVLNCFHFMNSTLLSVLFFRVFTFFSNKKKIYLKLDAGIDINRSIPKTKFEKFISKNIDVVSVENMEYLIKLNDKNYFKNKVIYVPNGFHSNKKKNVEYIQKENIILTVGRIGAVEKANDDLLRAFEIFYRKHNDWKLILVGPIDDSFKRYIEHFFLDFPELEKSIFFIGPVFDRNELEKYYMKAKIFSITSKYEGFPLVFLEALINGCTIISTNFPAARDICDDNKYGRIYNSGDIKKLSNIFEELSSNDEFLIENTLAVQQLAFARFDWNIIIASIFKEINK